MNYKGYDSQQATQVISIKVKIYRSMLCEIPRDINTKIFSKTFSKNGVK